MFVCKVGDPKTAAEIDRGDRMACARRSAARDLEALAVLCNQNVVVEDLRSRKEMDSPKLKGRVSFELVDGLVELFLVDAKRRSLPTHSHRPALTLAALIDAQRYTRPQAQPTSSGSNSRDLREGLRVDLADSLRECELEFALLLAGTSEQNLLSRATCA